MLRVFLLLMSFLPQGAPVVFCFGISSSSCLLPHGFVRPLWKCAEKAFVQCVRNGEIVHRLERRRRSGRGSVSSSTSSSFFSSTSSPLSSSSTASPPSTFYDSLTIIIPNFSCCLWFCIDIIRATDFVGVCVRIRLQAGFPIPRDLVDHESAVLDQKL